MATYKHLWRYVPFAAVAAYVAIVLFLDSALMFRWYLRNGFDAFKFVAWFLVPFICALPWLDWGALGVRRLHRWDWTFFCVALALGALSVLAVPFVPVLKAAFPHVPKGLGWTFFCHQTIYNLSWVTGWEFLHRYVLLRSASKVFPRFSWLLVPISETAYHLTWPTLVMPAGMLVFSLIATRWSLSRKNVLLPFLVHFGIETELLLFQLM